MSGFHSIEKIFFLTAGLGTAARGGGERHETRRS